MKTQTTAGKSKLKIISGFLTFNDTLKLMTDMIYRGSLNPYLRRQIQEIGEPLPFIKRDYNVADYYYTWVRDNIKYTAHPFNVQTLQTPEITLKQRSGDCANMTILLGAIYRSIGFNTGVCGVNVDNADYNHVYGLVCAPKGWYFYDATMKQGDFGEELDTKRYTKKAIMLMQ